jgi:DNA polymerase epsilon subunit 1
VNKLEKLLKEPLRKENPLIYHLDVAAMYPYIILTNRLQPTAIVSEEMCAACDFNRPENNWFVQQQQQQQLSHFLTLSSFLFSKRNMAWTWRGEYLPANRSEYDLIRLQLESEKFPDPKNKEKMLGYYELSPEAQQEKLKTRLKDYSKKVYKVTYETTEEERQSTVCMRENPFYVDTVKAFRDRRYIYKGKLKEAQRNLERVVKENAGAANVQEAEKLVVLYDSLQLAHKCILNSFYGYVMRRGARWYSMEMAGAVTYTGALIITKAREMVESVGRPLELDTDGIWCILPASFPENFKLKSTDPKTPAYTMSFLCTVLNRLVGQEFTNHQYQTFDPESKTYKTHSECSIFFEVDGPYRAMILPAAKEEGKKIKKRYAVFNQSGSLAELKGFEVKRRGELKMIKSFQSQLFQKFLEGKTLQESYQSVATLANSYLDIIDTKGENLADSELLDLLTESSSMSKKLEDYGKSKSNAITTAKRLGEFLGDQMVKEKGLACAYIVSSKPEGAPINERAIPVAIFQADEITRKKYIRKWTKNQGISQVDIRDILDWDHYRERIGSVIQKIITIPATFQKVENPVPRMPLPDWLQKLVNESKGNQKQKKIDRIFQKTSKEQAIEDIENYGKKVMPVKDSPICTVHKRSRKSFEGQKSEGEDEDGDQDEEEEEDEFMTWLRNQKKKWKIQLENRKNGKKLSKSKNLFTNMANVIAASGWQIIQIRETGSPGVLKLFVLIQQQLYPITVQVPRLFYINSRDPIPSLTKANQVLPRSKPKYNLYQYRMAESDFKSNAKVDQSNSFLLLFSFFFIS